MTKRVLKAVVWNEPEPAPVPFCTHHPQVRLRAPCRKLEPTAFLHLAKGVDLLLYDALGRAAPGGVPALDCGQVPDQVLEVTGVADPALPAGSDDLRKEVEVTGDGQSVRRAVSCIGQRAPRLVDSLLERHRYVGPGGKEAAIFEGPVKLAASPYADRPGYREEWRP